MRTKKKTKEYGEAKNSRRLERQEGGDSALALKLYQALTYQVRFYLDKFKWRKQAIPRFSVAHMRE